MKLLVLDFDGVIADSGPEAFAVALRTYLALQPDSPLRDRDHAALYAAFLDLMPLGNRAEDFGVALAAIEAGVALPDQAAYDAWFASRDPAWLRAFHQRFYRERAAIADADPAGWRALLPAYPRFLDVLRRRAGACRYAIATAKDRRSVGVLLREYGVADLFEADLVLDKETGVTKVAHHEWLARRCGVDYPDMTFVDDKVNHLDEVGALGVATALSAWGYNGPREHRLARAHGHRVLTLDDVEAQLFAATPKSGFKTGAAVDERG
jgi:phosphoglycolate phosphatase-like HAD superfamily hydrolase